jgi:arsenate reductase-like glutaredoxin family protein
MSKYLKLLAHAEQNGIQYLVQEFIDGRPKKKELKKLGGHLVGGRIEGITT